MDFFYRPPEIIKRIFPGIIWKNSQSEILLTIDDGPSENTFRVLDSLDRQGIKAVFFCTGKKIEEHFHEFNAILKAGHCVENHGYDHSGMLLKSKKQNTENIEKVNRIIKEYTGALPGFYRPPYGLFNHHTLKAVEANGMKMMLWTVLSGDHTGDFSTVRRLIGSYLRKGSIIVMHDNRKSSEIFSESLEYIVSTATDRKLGFCGVYDG